MSAVLERVRHRVTVDEFHKMGEAGIFMEDDRVERETFPGGTLAPRALPDCRVVVEELFPRL